MNSFYIKIASIITAILAFVGLILKAMSLGKDLEKGKQAEKENDTLVKQAKINEENTQIEELVNGLSDDDVDQRLHNNYRDDSNV